MPGVLKAAPLRGAAAGDSARPPAFGEARPAHARPRRRTRGSARLNRQRNDAQRWAVFRGAFADRRVKGVLTGLRRVGSPSTRSPKFPRRSPPVKGRSRSFGPGPSTRAGPYGLPLVPRGASCPTQSILAAYCGPLTRGARRGYPAVGVRERWLIMLWVHAAATSPLEMHIRHIPAPHPPARRAAGACPPRSQYRCPGASAASFMLSTAGSTAQGGFGIGGLCSCASRLVRGLVLEEACLPCCRNTGTASTRRRSPAWGNAPISRTRESSCRRTWTMSPACLGMTTCGGDPGRDKLERGGDERGGRSRAERISQLVYLDAFVPDDGQAVFDLIPPQRRPAMEALVETEGFGWLLPGSQPSHGNSSFARPGRWPMRLI